MPTVHELYNEAEKLKDAGQYPEAVAKLEAALALDDKHVLSHLALGILYGKVGKWPEAVQHAERAVQIEPNDTYNYTMLSVVYQRAWAATQDYKYIQLAEEAKARGAMMGGHHH
jgi:tetratricopeptide (TPR) repeat protein